jgi:predicted nucleic acid-binding protein
LPILVDSSVWIDFFRGARNRQSDYLASNLGEIEFVVGDLILTEVLQGFRTQRDFNDARKALLSFEVQRIVSEANAIQSAVHYRFLRDQGYTIPKTVDCWIATFCLTNDFQLLHSDADFDPFEKLLGLRVVHP